MNAEKFSPAISRVNAELKSNVPGTCGISIIRVILHIDPGDEDRPSLWNVRF
jgi:hypothetical protein